MHVHELNPKKTLIALVAFVLLLVVGFLTMHKPLLSYELNMKQSLQMLKEQNTCFYPYQLVGVLNKKDKNVVLIDLRNHFVYGQGHIPGAENISAYDLTRKENIDRMENFKKQGVTVVLYGEDQLQINGPWMLFRQVGFDNVKILLGGYKYYLKHQNDLSATKTDKSYLKGNAQYDYAKVASSSATVGDAPVKTKKTLIVHRRKKAAAAAGGC